MKELEPRPLACLAALRWVARSYARPPNSSLSRLDESGYQTTGYFRGLKSPSTCTLVTTAPNESGHCSAVIELQLRNANLCPKNELNPVVMRHFLRRNLRGRRGQIITEQQGILRGELHATDYLYSIALYGATPPLDLCGVD